MTTQGSSFTRPNVRLQALPKWLPISLILIAATAIFTHGLGDEGLWIDELFSIRDASQSLVEVYKDTQFRPLYYLLLSVWMKFGQSDAWLRIPSVIAGVVSVFLIYRLGRRIAGEAEGLTAAALLSTSTLFINHAQEVRMYALSLCMGLAGSLFLANALLPPQRSDLPGHAQEDLAVHQPNQKTIAGWALFRLLAIWTVPLNLTLLGADVLLIFIRFRRERRVLLSFAGWLAFALALWSPAVVTLLADMAPSSEYAVSREQYLAPPGLNNLVYPLKFWMVDPQVVRLGPLAHNFYKFFTVLLAGVIGAGLIRKHKSPGWLWVGAWFLIPILPIIAFSHFSAQIWEPRYVLFVSPYLLLLITAGFSRLWKDWKPAAIFAISIYTFAMGWALVHYFNVQNRGDYRFNVETIEASDQPGDAIVWGYAWDDPMRYYYDGEARTYHLDMSEIETPGAIQPWIDQIPTEYQRLWLVLDDVRPMDDELQAAIANNYNIKESFSYEHRSTVMLVTPKAAPTIAPAPTAKPSPTPTP
jgi:mannosyltransferase